MQKALIVWGGSDDSGPMSVEVDPAGRPINQPLRRLLADGWRILQTCPMTGDEPACLVVLERAEEPLEPAQGDPPLARLTYGSAWQGLQGGSPAGPTSPPQWDGSTIPLPQRC